MIHYRNSNSTARFKLPAFSLALLLCCDVSRGWADSSPASSPTNVVYDFGGDPINPADASTRWLVSSPTLITWEKDVTHVGKGALKLTNPDQTKNVITYGPYIPYTGPSLKLSVDVKQDSVVTGVFSASVKASVAIYYYDQDKNPISKPWPKYHDILALPDGSLDWTPYNVTFNLPNAQGAVAFVRVVINLAGSGTIWVDNITLTQGS